jgi:exo-beta-1,3-glucanase (GH17 family)
MSFRVEKFNSYKNTLYAPQADYLTDFTEEDYHDLFLEVLYNGVHGFCFSLYEEGQQPGDIIGEDQIRRRIEIIKPYSQWIRSFSCTEGNELIPKVAKENGMKTLVGAWLGKDLEKNEEEIQGLIQLAKQGLVDIAAVGNEVLYRKDLTDQQLLEYIERVKQAIPGVPVGYVDAYYEFTKLPYIADACDILLCNCYPYWEGTSIEHAFNHMKQMYYQVKNANPHKRVLITETGWPSQGESLGGAHPSHNNALKYFINTQLWSQDDSIEIFYFSSFDESWKKSAEGEVGAFWGVWDSNGKLKF